MLNIVDPSWTVTAQETEVPSDVKSDIQAVFMYRLKRVIVQYKMFRRSKTWDHRTMGSQDHNDSLMNTVYVYKNILP